MRMNDRADVIEHIRDLAYSLSLAMEDARWRCDEWYAVNRVVHMAENLIEAGRRRDDAWDRVAKHDR